MVKGRSILSNITPFVFHCISPPSHLVPVHAFVNKSQATMEDLDTLKPWSHILIAVCACPHCSHSFSFLKAHIYKFMSHAPRC